MRKTILFLAIITVFTAMNTSINAQVPQLIDRELFFGNPEISGAQISPDGKFISFIKPLDDVRNIWIKSIDEPFEKARPLTDEKKRPIPGYFWSWDNKILFVKDNDGDENFNVYSVNPTAPPAEGKKVPSATNLTNATGVQTQIHAVPESEPDFIYIGINDRDKAWHDLYKVRISTGEKTLLRENKDRMAGWIFDNKDRLRLAVRSAENGDTEILKVDGDKFTKIYSCSVFEICTPIRFYKDDKRFYMETNKGERDLSQLVLFDPETQKEEFVEQDPQKRVDFGSALFSEVTDELIGTTYYDDKLKIYWKDKKFKNDYETIKKRLGEREISFSSGTKDEQKWIVVSYSDTDPGTVWIYDRKTKDLSTLYQVREKLNRQWLAEMKPIRYKSSDGLEIPAYLTLPKGVEAKNLPLIVVPHGGPWGRDTWGYNSIAQFLANRGYAVLMPNFRASTGYGKKFLDSGNMQWGDLMQDDITWGVKHLVDQGIADPKRVGIMGGSYGGYATLAGVTYTPDLYAVAVAIVAPSNLITLLNSIPPYWEQIRQLFYKRMGDPNTEAGRKQLERQSPLNYVEKIKTPLMIVQGANDPRVKKAESDQIVIALRERNYPVQYLLADDEGHGFQRPVNNMAMFAAAEEFLAKHLDGRFQETMPETVEKRLKELDVDVKTVTMTEKVDLSKLPEPKPVSDLIAGTSNMDAKIEFGGQEIPLSIVSEIKEENGNWIITDTAQTPQGAIKETTVVEKGTLTVKKRTINQGGMTIEYEVKDGRAVGKMGEKAFDVELGGALFADGAGSYDVIAALPLKEGYTTVIRNFDVQSQKPETRVVKVVGMEQITVPAGTFEAYKIESVSTDNEADKTTVWISKDRKVLKIQSVMLQMGGAIMTVVRK